MFASCKKHLSKHSCATLVPLGWSGPVSVLEGMMCSLTLKSVDGAQEVWVWCVACVVGCGVSRVGVGGVVWNAFVVVLFICCCLVDCRLCVVGCVSVILDPLSVVSCIKNDF